MKTTFKRAWPKAVAVFLYCSTHRKQLSAAVAFGAALLEAAQKAH